MNNFDRFIEAKVDTVAGMPAFIIDGKPYGAMSYQFSARGRDVDFRLKNFGEAGIKLYFINEGFSDPSEIEDFMTRLHQDTALLKKNVPDAKAMIWFIIRPYADFAKKYPGDVITFNDGTTGGWLDHKFMGLPDKDTPRYSFASEAWKNEVGSFVKEVIRQIGESDDLRETIVGYFFYALCFEWSWFWDYDKDKVCMDYSPAMQNAFRNFLVEKYIGDEKKLQAAWKDDTVTFETAKVPTYEQRHTTDYGWFWDPKNNAQVKDYAECHCDVLSDKLWYFSKVVKEATGGRALVGSFYGYLQNQDFMWGGQSRFKKMLDCPYLDFWAAPFTYENKAPGGFTSMRMIVKTLQQHNKVWLAEADTFVYDSGGLQHHGFPNVTKDESEELLKRDFSYILCDATQAWWIDWSSGDSQYKEDEFKPLMARMQELEKESFKMDLRGVSDIAAVVDQESLIVTQDPNAITNVANITDMTVVTTEEEIIKKYPSHLLYNAIDRFRVHELCRIGSPVDFYETDDILTNNHRKHKMYIFLNAYQTDDYERKLIAEKLKKDGNVLVFMYGAGLIAPEGNITIGPENVSELTGMKMGVKMENRRARMVTLNGASANLPGLRDGDEIGDFERVINCGFDFRANQQHPFMPAPNRVNPVIYVDDESATPLASYIEGGEISFAMKEFEDWTSIYIGSPAVQAYVLRAIAKKAGAHLYVDDEDVIIYANQSYVGIHTAEDKERTIHLHEGRDVYEVFDKRTVAKNSTEFTEFIPKNSTRLYCLRPECLEENQ